MIFFFRFFNIFKLYLSFFLSSVLNKYIHWGFPFSLSIEITSYCNLKCPQCEVGLNKIIRKKNQTDIITFEKIIDQTKPNLWVLNMYFQGEPLLHKQFTEMLSIAKKSKIYVIVSSNFYNVNYKIIEDMVKFKLDKLIIGIDGLTSNTYLKYRLGSNFENVIENVKLINIVKNKYNSKYPKLVLQFIVNKHNEHEVENVKQFAALHNFDSYLIKTMQVINKNKEEWNPIKQIYIRDLLGVKTKKSICWRSWSGAVITSDGDICPCCFDKSASYAFGNINNQDVKSVFKNNNADNFRKNIMANRNTYNICINCVEGRNNYYL